MESVIIYSSGISACSACVKEDLPIKEIEKRTNILNPTGISSKWKVSKDTHFKDGINTNPCQCQDHKNRKHYLLTC